MTSAHQDYIRQRVKIDKDGCWNWTRSLGSHGYGQGCLMRLTGKRVSTAHTLSYLIFHGDIPKGMYVLHKCGNRRCCNPDHLYLGDQKQNHLDSVRHGTASKPPDFYGQEVRNQYGTSSVNDERIAEAVRRFDAGETQAALAKEYGVHFSTVSKWVRGRNRPTGQSARRGWNVIVTPEREQEVIARFHAGEAMSSIGKSFGCDHHPINRFLIKKGLK